MVLQSTSFRIVTAALLLGAGACADNPSAPETTTPNALAVRTVTPMQAEPPGRVDGFLCRTSILTPAGPYRYRYGHLKLGLPPRRWLPMAEQCAIVTTCSGKVRNRHVSPVA